MMGENASEHFGKNIRSVMRSYVIDACYVAAPVAIFLPTGMYNLSLILFFVAIALKPSAIGLRYGWTPLLILLVPLAIHVLALLQDVLDHNAKAGFSHVESQLSLLVMAVFINQTYSERGYRIALTSFVVSTFCAVTVCLAVAFYKNYAFHDAFVQNWDLQGTVAFYNRYPIGLMNWGYFTYASLADAVGFHPVYLGVYVLTATIIVAFSIFRDGLSLRMKIFLGALLLYFGLFISMLGGKMPIFTALFLALLCVAKEFAYTADRKRKFAYVILFVVAFGGVLLMPSIRYRLENLMQTAKQFAAAKEDTTRHEDEMKEMHRLYLWETTIKQGREKFWMGHGLAGSRAAMKQAFAADGNSYFNSHNEYLNYFLISGIVGMLLFIAYMVFLQIFSFRTHDYLYFFFIITVSVTAVTENFLSRNKGVVLFALMHALFVHRYFYHKKKDVKI